MNKTVLVTGASGGLGRQLSQDLCDHNLLLVSRNPEKIKVNAHKFTFDLTNEGAPESLCHLLIQNQLIPDIIIHNIGGTVMDDTHPLSIQVLRSSMRLNLEIAAEINSILIPKMNPGSKVIHISSDAGITGRASPAYAAAKGALNAYVKSLARYYASKGIQIFAVLPGIFEFEGSAWDRKKNIDPESYNECLTKMPLKRFGRVTEISETIVSLCHGDSMMLNGTLLVLDGGA